MFNIECSIHLIIHRCDKSQILFPSPFIVIYSKHFQNYLQQNCLQCCCGVDERDIRGAMGSMLLSSNSICSRKGNLNWVFTTLANENGFSQRFRTWIIFNSLQIIAIFGDSGLIQQMVRQSRSAIVKLLWTSLWSYMDFTRELAIKNIILQISQKSENGVWTFRYILAKSGLL